LPLTVLINIRVSCLRSRIGRSGGEQRRDQDGRDNAGSGVGAGGRRTAGRGRRGAGAGGGIVKYIRGPALLARATTARGG